MNQHFKESLDDGAIGERVAWDVFSKKEWVAQIVDLRDDARSQARDIDFLLLTYKRQCKYLEVKTDFMAHSTGNIAYETSTSGNLGCFYKTGADLVFYYLPNARRAYLIDVKRIRDYVDTYPHNEVKMGDNAKGFLIPINKLIEKQVIIATYEGV